MPVSLMSEWPHVFVGLSFKFHLDEGPTFSIVKKKKDFFLLQSEARHYSTPDAFDYFFLITSSNFHSQS